MKKEPRDPLRSVEEWDDHVRQRYRQDREHVDFRDFRNAPGSVQEFYRQNHENQTLELVQAKQRAFRPGQREPMPMWESLERLNELVDDSDPDTDLPQIAHSLQTAERIRADHHPDWMQLIGLIHDAGKMLCFYGEPQWAVVGDTFPVGCAWSEKIVFHELFQQNPDSDRPELQTRSGIYEDACGLDNVHLSWGHDEYIYQVVKESELPVEALYMLRYHSFYPWHREGAYRFLMNDKDREMLPWVQKFNQYDLYSKSDELPDIETLKPYYCSLIDKYLPTTVAW